MPTLHTIFEKILYIFCGILITLCATALYLYKNKENTKDHLLLVNGDRCADEDNSMYDNSKNEVSSDELFFPGCGGFF